MIVIHYLLFFIFLIANIYTPISFHYAMEINLFFLLLIKIGYRSKTVLVDRTSVFIVFLLLFYSFFITFIRTGTFALDVPVNFIYFLLCIVSYPYIVDFFINKKVDVLTAISIVLSIHCVVVLLEVLSPEFSAIKTMLFDYNRDDIEKYLLLDYRKMGLATSFDTAGYFATLSSILSFLLFYMRRNPFFFLLFFISACSSITTSRTGMLLTFWGTITCVFFFWTNRRGNNTVLLKMITISSVIAIIVVGVLIVLPIVGADLGMDFKGVGLVSDIHDNYTDTSVNTLVTDHTTILDMMSVSELLFGTGQVFRRVQDYLSYTTDVGYFRQIFEVGIVGLSVMLLFLYNNWMRLRSLKHKCDSLNLKDSSISLLFFYYHLMIICLLLLNYKNYFLFDRGKFEIYCLVYFILLNSFRQVLYGKAS